jgi:hypothetical protein
MLTYALYTDFMLTASLICSQDGGVTELSTNQCFRKTLVITAL